MKLVSRLEIIENPQFVRTIYLPSLKREVSLYEDGSAFCTTSGQFYAPQAEDVEALQMRKDFDQRRAIRPGDRYLASNRDLRINVARYGVVA